MIANEWLLLMKLAGPPITDTTVAPWYGGMAPDFKQLALARVVEIWSTSRDPDFEDYLWSWACALEHADRCCQTK